MDVIPKEITYAVAKMESFNRNTYRLESSGASTAGPNQIITVVLPSNAVLDLRSFQLHLNIATTADATSTNAIYGKLPADTSSLIQSCRLFRNMMLEPLHSGIPRRTLPTVHSRC